MNEFVFSAIEGFSCGLASWFAVWKLVFVVRAMRGSIDDALRND